MDEQTIAQTTEATEQTEAKTYTQEDFEKALQSETDKRVSQALEKQERKNQAKIKEAERLAKMSEEQRYNYELESREKAIQEKEEALALAENKAEAAKQLAAKGISANLVSLVVAKDADTMLDNITLLENEFKASVKAEVERRLTTSTPKKNLPIDGNITKADFHKMSLAQQAELYRNNPSLYNSLSGRN